MYVFRRFPTRSRRVLPALLLLFVVATAQAASPTFGVAVTPITGGMPAVTASALLPFAAFDSTVGAVTLAGRADLTAAFDVSAVPAFGLNAVATIDSGEHADSYVGTGLSLAWRNLDGDRASFLAWTVLAGVRYPFSDVLAARIEATAAPAVAGFGLAVGVDVTPWK